MQKKILWFAFVLKLTSTLQLKGQYSEKDSIHKGFCWEYILDVR